MNKKKIIFIIAVFIGIVILFRMSGVLRTYTIPSSSSEPNIKVGSRIIGSSLKTPKPLDFAYFKFSDSLDGWTIVKRLIAIPGDTLECKNGNYFVNSNNLDKDLNLRFAYKMLPDIFNTYIKGKISDTESYKYYDSDSIIAFLDDSFIKNLPINLDRNYNDKKPILPNEVFNENANWTTNNFGPIIIPEGKYFFSGDNRDNSIDSRHRGFVDGEHILGTVLINF